MSRWASRERHLLLLGLLWTVSVNAAGAAEQEIRADRWFGTDSPWNIPVGNALEQPFSQSAINAFLSSGAPFNLNMDSWTPAVIYADSGKDSTQTLIFSAGYPYPWKMPDVPVPQELQDYARYRLSIGDTDGMVCLYDKARDGFYSFWKLSPSESGEGISVRTGGFSPNAGPGWADLSGVTDPKKGTLATPSLGRVAGASYCGGLIRPDELASGKINHALAVAWPAGLVLSRDFPGTHLQYPATETDGKSFDSITSVPMGARLQLDPALTDAQLRQMGLNERDLVVAHALQIYGGYVVDTTVRTAAVCFQNLLGQGRKTYGVTNPWPRKGYRYFRFVAPPASVPLDTAQAVGTPVLY